MDKQWVMEEVWRILGRQRTPNAFQDLSIIANKVSQFGLEEFLVSYLSERFDGRGLSDLTDQEIQAVRKHFDGYLVLKNTAAN